jgi:hypothetical protein
MRITEIDGADNTVQLDILSCRPAPAVMGLSGFRGRRNQRRPNEQNTKNAEGSRRPPPPNVFEHSSLRFKA